MKNKIRVAVLGSTGYVGMELVKILLNHSYVDINFLGSETIHGSYLNNIDNTKEFDQLPESEKDLVLSKSKVASQVLATYNKSI